MKIRIGDPVVFRHEKYRVLRLAVDISGGILLKERFGGKVAIVQPGGMTWDDEAGLWRAARGVKSEASDG